MVIDSWFPDAELTRFSLKTPEHAPPSPQSRIFVDLQRFLPRKPVSPARAANLVHAKPSCAISLMPCLRQGRELLSFALARRATDESFCPHFGTAIQEVRPIRIEIRGRVDHLLMGDLLILPKLQANEDKPAMTPKSARIAIACPRSILFIVLSRIGHRRMKCPRSRGTPVISERRYRALAWR